MPEPDPTRPTFDEQVCTRLRDAAQAVLAEFPEVDSLALVINWRGRLNDVATPGLWLGQKGTVASAEGILGSAQQTLKMLDEQFRRAAKLQEYIQDNIHVLGNELRRLNETQEPTGAGPD